MIQTQALNYILQNKDASIITLNNLNDSFFSDYKDEFNYIKNHLDSYGNVPDQESFLASFPNFDVIKVSENSRYIIDELYKDKNKRMLANTFNNVRKLLEEGKVEEAVKLYSNASQDVSQVVNMNCIDLVKDVTRYDKYVEKCNDYSKAYVKTGWSELDNIIGGWDRNDEYATIVARPGMSKSWCLLKTAIAAAEQGLTVGIYSGEMSANAVGYRFDTLFGHISNRQLIHGDIEVQNLYKKYLDNLQSQIKGSIKVLTPDMIGGSAGILTLKAFVEKEHLDMLCIDQHSLLEDDRHGKSAPEKASNISKDIKNLQVMKRIPIITVSQQNRESTEEGLSTKFVAQSDRIGQDSTVVIFLEKKDNVLTLVLAKSRNSESGKKLQYAIDLDKGIFTYIPAESDALNGQSSDDLKREYDGDLSGGEDVF